MTWENEAACLNHDPEMWFPVSVAGPAKLVAAKAKAICGGCPVRAKCAEEAMPYGIWGGTSEDDRLQGPRPKNYPQITSDADAELIRMVERGESMYSISRFLKARMDVARRRVDKLRDRGLLDHVDA